MDAMEATATAAAGGSVSAEAADLGLGLGFPVWVAARRRFKPDDSFFAAGNLERELLAKHVALDLTEDERHLLQKMEIMDDNLFCPMAGCGVRLQCLEEFEEHYNTRHMASCSVCSRVYPTSRLLSIHISEVHDSFFQAKVARGFPMYECLVEGCGAKLKSYNSRKRHLIDKHRFPTTFEFHKRSHPSKNQRQKLQRKGYKGGGATKDHESLMDLDAKEESKMEVELQKDKMEVEGKIEEIVDGLSKLTTVDPSSPATVSFGHRHSRGFAFIPRSVRNQTQNSKRETTMKP